MMKMSSMGRLVGAAGSSFPSPASGRGEAERVASYGAYAMLHAPFGGAMTSRSSSGPGTVPSAS